MTGYNLIWIEVFDVPLYPVKTHYDSLCGQIMKNKERLMARLWRLFHKGDGAPITITTHYGLLLPNL